MGRVFVVIKRMKEILDEDSFYPDMPRKSRTKRAFELFKFLVRDKKINNYYNSFGFDVEGFKNLDDYYTEGEFVPIRNAANTKGIHTDLMDYNYVCLLRDKFVFSQYLNSIFNSVVPENICYLSHGVIRFPQTLEGGIDEFLDYIKSLQRTVVVKNCNGQCADGVFFVSNDNDELIINKGEIALEYFKSTLKQSDFLVQDVVVQHDKLSVFNSSVNTIRIVTARNRNGEINILAKKLRMGVDNSLFDNSAAGGVYVGIDDEGKLMKYGFKHPEKNNRKFESHPSSNIRFEGYQLPYFEEVKKLVLNAHAMFPTVVSIGWDVCVTPDGPILIEGNDNWEMPVLEDCVGGLKNKYLELTK